MIASDISIQAKLDDGSKKTGAQEINPRHYLALIDVVKQVHRLQFSFNLCLKSNQMAYVGFQIPREPC